MTQARPAVFYDGACPLCRREIGFYRKQKGAEDIEWIDVSACDTPYVAEGLTKAEALRRFHVLRTDGELVGGALAFSELWARLPKFRLAGRIARLPVIRSLLEAGYRAFLTIRRKSWRPEAEERS